MFGTISMKWLHKLINEFFRRYVIVGKTWNHYYTPAMKKYSIDFFESKNGFFSQQVCWLIFCLFWMPNSRKNYLIWSKIKCYTTMMTHAHTPLPLCSLDSQNYATNCCVIHHIVWIQPCQISFHPKFETIAQWKKSQQIRE